MEQTQQVVRRYSRVEQVEMIGAQGLAELQSAKVAVLGVGNIGGEALRHLVALGIPVLLVDRDVVKEENLATQGFTEVQLGRPKVEARACYLSWLNPECAIEFIHADVARLGLGALRDASLILCCLDNRGSRAMVNEVAMRMGVPWIDAALDGSGKSLFGRVAAYDPRATGSACYLCPHDRDSLAKIMRESAGEGCPIWQWGEAEVASPTLAVSALGAAVASIQVIWGLKLLLDRGAEVTGREIYIDLGRGATSLQSLRRNERCLLEHAALELTRLGGAARELTVEETFQIAERQLGSTASLQLHRRAIATEVRCQACGGRSHPNRLADAIRGEEMSCGCGAQMRPAAAGLLDRFGREGAFAFLNRSWQQIGLPASDVVTATGSRAQIHMLFG